MEERRTDAVGVFKPEPNKVRCPKCGNEVNTITNKCAKCGHEDVPYTGGPFIPK